MKAQLIPALVLAAFGLFSQSPSAWAKSDSLDAAALDTLANNVLSTNSAEAGNAVAELRAAGPAGLEALFRVYGDRRTKEEITLKKDGSSQSLRAVFNEVGQQRDCYASHLYWYTDWEQAKRAAKALGKPILSLRLLGKLNEEYSCANSRFFRTTLYPNAEVSRYLRDHFVLHWQSVRPVPRITIDMGDGRRIERTITGNSIHYVLDADGNPIDALPGLYGASVFLVELNRAFEVEQQAVKLQGPERANFLRDYHSTRLVEIRRQWASDLATVNGQATAEAFRQSSTLRQTPDAIAAAPLTAGKAQVENPSAQAKTRLEALSTDDVWQKIAALHKDDGRVDANSRQLIQFKQPPTAAEAARMTFSKTIVETPMMRMIWNLESSIAEDTVRNEYELHSRIHEWFANGTAPANLDALNSKIYAELFLTPNSDAWLGLAPADVYSALDNGGLVQTKN